MGHILVSMLFGLGGGCLLFRVVRRPRTWLGFALTAIAILPAYWVGVQTYLVNFDNEFVVLLNYFLMALFAGMALSFLAAHFRRAVIATTPQG